MEQIQLSNIADIVSGYAIPSADMVEEGTPIIKITNIKEDGSLDLENTAKYNKPITPKVYTQRQGCCGVYDWCHNR